MSEAGFICLIHSNIPFFQDADHFSMIENTIFLFFPDFDTFLTTTL